MVTFEQFVRPALLQMAGHPVWFRPLAARHARRAPAEERRPPALRARRARARGRPGDRAQHRQPELRRAALDDARERAADLPRRGRRCCTRATPPASRCSTRASSPRPSRASEGGRGGGRVAPVLHLGRPAHGRGGTRLGRDKARVPLAGVPAATRLARRLARLCEDVLLVGGDPPADAPGRRVPDPPGPAARCAAWSARSRRRAPSACWWSRPTCRSSPRRCCSRWSPGPRPTRWCRATRGSVTRSARCSRASACCPSRSGASPRGSSRCTDLFGELGTAWLEGEVLARLDPDGVALSNVNTPEDLARVERRLTPAGG